MSYSQLAAPKRVPLALAMVTATTIALSIFGGALPAHASDRDSVQHVESHDQAEGYEGYAPPDGYEGYAPEPPPGPGEKPPEKPPGKPSEPPSEEPSEGPPEKPSEGPSKEPSEVPSEPTGHKPPSDTLAQTSWPPHILVLALVGMAVAALGTGLIAGTRRGRSAPTA